MEYLVAAVEAVPIEPNHRIVIIRSDGSSNIREHGRLGINASLTAAEKNEQTRVQIQYLFKHGQKASSISKLLNISQKTVHKWKDRINVKDLPRKGRPVSVLTPEIKQKITDLCKDHWNASTRKVTLQLNTSHEFINRGQSVSRSSVGNYIRSTDWGKIAYKVGIAPMLSQKNVQDRMAFATRVIGDGYCEDSDRAKHLLDHILFTDESYVELYPRPNKQNTRIRTTYSHLRERAGIPKQSLKILVAGGLCTRGLTSLHVASPNVTITGDYYRQNVLPVYSNSVNRANSLESDGQQQLFTNPSDVTFMQDGAPAHTARATLDLIHQRYQTTWSKNVWPGNSPDLNPIENLWSLLQESVFIEPRPRNRVQLVDRVLVTWHSFSTELTRRLVHSFPTRIRQCLERLGGSTNY
jgi:transposase